MLFILQWIKEEKFESLEEVLDLIEKGIYASIKVVLIS